MHRNYLTRPLDLEHTKPDFLSKGGGGRGCPHSETFASPRNLVRKQLKNLHNNTRLQIIPGGKPETGINSKTEN